VTSDEIQRVQAIKSVALGYAAYFGDIRRHLSAEFAAEVRWLTASLFALNGGGLVALNGQTTFCRSDAISGLFFLLGVSCAFGHVLYSQQKTIAFLGAIQKLEEVYILASATGSLDEAKAAEWEKKRYAVTTGFSRYLSGSSFAFFCIGLVLLAYNKLT
jgi:hypothetical protein